MQIAAVIAENKNNSWGDKNVLNYDILQYALFTLGARDGVVGWGTALEAGGSRVRFLMVSVEFFMDLIFPAALRLCGRLSL